MEKLFSSLKRGMSKFARDEEGAQIVEYALIIAVVSIALIVLLNGLTTATGGFTTWIARVTTCLTGTGTCS